MKIESVFAFVILLLLILKYNNYPGSNVFFAAAMISLSIIYFVFAFYLFCDKQIANQNLKFSILSGIFLSMAPLGILYKIMYWNNDQRYLIIGLLSSIAILGIAYFLKSKSLEQLETYYKNMVLRTGILTLISMLLFITPSTTLMNIEFRHDPERNRLKSLIYANPDNTEYKKQLNEYLLNRDSLKLK